MTTAELFSHKPTLTGTLIELHPFNDEATESMLEILMDPEVLIKTGSVNSAQEAESNPHGHDYKSWYAARNEQTDRLDLAIYDKTAQQYVGEVVFNDYDPKNKSVNYRIAIGEKGRGKGLGTEATKLMIDYGFEELGLNRISLEVYDFNKRARYVYSSCGFVSEGRLREALYYNGEYHDAIIKSIIRSDWESIHACNSLMTAPIDTVVTI